MKKDFFRFGFKNLMMSYELTPHDCGGISMPVSRLATLIGLTLTSFSVCAEDYFNPEALEVRGVTPYQLDLSAFSQPGGQLPGNYVVDIYVNGEWKEKTALRFIDSNGTLSPEISIERLRQLGVNVDAFPELAQKEQNEHIDNLGKYIPHSGVQLDFNQQKVSLSIPQAAIRSQARGYVAPELWDHGLNALLFNYYFSGSQTEYVQHSMHNNNNYFNLRSGANLGAWRLRNYSVWTNSSANTSKWESINTYAQRDIPFLDGKLTIGDSSTSSDVFDAFLFRGINLASDDNMLPDSQKGFAPVVRAIAQSNAEITIRQGGYVIYQSYVAAGPFVISDLYPTSSQGDLEITIKESDGRERVFRQAFSSVPIMQREGRLKYSFSAGKYRSTNVEATKPNVGTATLIYGLPHDTTVYGGVIVSENYNAAILGVGSNPGAFGSVSLDMTSARTHFESLDKENHGQSWRVQYSRDFNETGTTFTLASYRYSTQGYYDFEEANELARNSTAADHKRSRVQVDMTQTTDRYGSFYISGYQQNYWNKAGKENNISAGYNGSAWDIMYGISYSYSFLKGSGKEDRQLALTVQVPLSKWLPGSWASYNMTTNKMGKTAQQLTLNGTALKDNNFTYSIGQSYGNQGEGYSGNTSADYKGTYGQVKAGYNYNQDSRQVNYGVSGGVIVHPYGVTLSQPLGDTLALVKAAGGEDIKVENQTGVYTDWRGYTVVPYLSPYRKNRIALDSGTYSDDVDIDFNATSVIPTTGAVVLADFKTRIGQRVLFTLQKEGKFVPFGTSVTLSLDKETTRAGIVGSEGEVYFSGVPEKGQLVASWGNAINQQCSGDYVLPEKGKTATLVKVNVQCRQNMNR